MKDLKQEMLDKKVWAVAGATDNKDRYGYKIWKTLKEHGYTVYGVNPRLEELEGEKIYKSVKDIPEKVDVVDIVVNPKVAVNTLEEAKEAGIEYVWFQPGSYDESVVEKAKDLNLKSLENDCIYATLKLME